MSLWKRAKPLVHAIIVLTAAGLADVHAADLLVSSTNTSHVLRYDGTSGTFTGVFAAGSELDAPVGLAFGPDNNLYVGSLGTSQILRYSGSTGAFIDVFASGGGLSEPSGLVFGPDGHLYVSNRSPSQILRYDGTTGALMDVFGSDPGPVGSARTGIRTGRQPLRQQRAQSPGRPVRRSHRCVHGVFAGAGASMDPRGWCSAPTAIST